MNKEYYPHGLLDQESTSLHGHVFINHYFTFTNFLLLFVWVHLGSLDSRMTFNEAIDRSLKIGVCFNLLNVSSTQGTVIKTRYTCSSSIQEETNK